MDAASRYNVFLSPAARVESLDDRFGSVADRSDCNDVTAAACKRFLQLMQNYVATEVLGKPAPKSQPVQPVPKGPPKFPPAVSSSTSRSVAGTGEGVASATFPCASCGAKRQTGNYCSMCGKPLPLFWKCVCGVEARGQFCSSCGSAKASAS